MTKLEQIQNIVGNVVENTKTEEREDTRIKYSTNKEGWALESKLEAVGYKKVADAYWTQVFERDNHVVTIERVIKKEVEENAAVESAEVKEVKLEEGMVIHCDTQIKVTSLLMHCAEKGINWISGKIATSFNPFPSRYKKTCIEVTDHGIAFGTLEIFQKNQEECGYKIMEFDELGIELAKEVSYDLEISDYDVCDKELAREEENFYLEQIEIMKEKYGNDNVEQVWGNKRIRVTILPTEIKNFESRLNMIENIFREIEFSWKIKEEV